MTKQPPDPMGEWMEAQEAWTREAEIRREEQRVRKQITEPHGWWILPGIAVGVAFWVAVAVWLI